MSVFFCRKLYNAWQARQLFYLFRDWSGSFFYPHCLCEIWLLPVCRECRFILLNFCYFAFFGFIYLDFCRSFKILSSVSCVSLERRVVKTMFCLFAGSKSKILLRLFSWRFFFIRLMSSTTRMFILEISTRLSAMLSNNKAGAAMITFASLAEFSCESSAVCFRDIC